jgi:hypothetical protein
MVELCVRWCDGRWVVGGSTVIHVYISSTYVTLVFSRWNTDIRWCQRFQEAASRITSHIGTSEEADSLEEMMDLD